MCGQTENSEEVESSEWKRIFVIAFTVYIKTKNVYRNRGDNMLDKKGRYVWEHIK